MSEVLGFVGRVLADMGFQLLWVVGPLAACGVVLHLLERAATGMLAGTFGWKSVLWTGWIGTPIHELSHAATCLVFGHEVTKLALFEPDPRSGCLGYVEHRHNPGNPWAVIGKAFIGIAPLFGGAAAMYGLMHLLLPSGLLHELLESRSAGLVDAQGFVAQGVASLSYGVAILGDLFRPENLLTWQFWVFLYLVVCIGTHLAPSPTDLSNTAAGFGAILGLLLVANVIAQAAGGVGARHVVAVAAFLMPVVALLLFAIVLDLFVLVLLFVVCVLAQRLRGRSWSIALLVAKPYRLHLGVVAALALALFVANRAVGTGGRGDRGAGGAPVTAAATAGPQSLCGAPGSRPDGVPEEAWSAYRCLDRPAAVERWPRCLPRAAYTPERGRGCPGDRRCCP